jgi:phosphatidylglycerol:prolipoprotein diacylglycerol transferase
MGGALALFLFTRHNHLNFLQWADIAAPAVALGQAIGRWGNFVNQELYGAPTNLPWAIYISPEHRVPGYQNFAYYQPLFLYESIWNLLNMAFLLWLARRYKDRLKMGDLFLIYLIGYPVGRFFLDFIRLDASQVAGIDINQALSAAVAIAAALVLFLRHRRSVAQANQVQQDQVQQE